MSVLNRYDRLSADFVICNSDAVVERVVAWTIGRTTARRREVGTQRRMRCSMQREFQLSDFKRVSFPQPQIFGGLYSVIRVLSL